MGYYWRILTPSKAWVPIAELQAAVEAANLPAQVSVTQGDGEKWLQCEVTSQPGKYICLIERNELFDGSLCAEELEEFLEDIEDSKPVSAACWLKNYLSTVQTIYAFQLLSGVESNSGYEALYAVQTRLWSKLSGIFQYDEEGFSNEEDYHILWQFGEDAKGPKNMAVLNDESQWTRFEMDLANPEHRSGFKAGTIPAGCQLIKPAS